MIGEYPRFKQCTVCLTPYQREGYCPLCPKPEQQKVRGKPESIIGSEPWGRITMAKEREAEKMKKDDVILEFLES